MNADGTWRKRKGLNDAAYVAKIKAELKAAMAVPAAPVATPAHDPATAASVTATAQAALSQTLAHLPAGVEIDGLHQGGAFPGESAPAPFVPPAPVIPAPSAVPAVPTAPTPAPVAATPGAIPTTLPELMPRITAAVTTGKLPAGALLEACQMNGIADLPSLAHRLDLIPTVWNTLVMMHPGVVQ